MIVSAIVATDRNRVIGKDNEIPWYLPGDMAYFKQTTMYHHVIMGRKTFDSIGRPLPKRTNIVLSNNPYFVANDIIVAQTIEEALELAAEVEEDEAFIIGGGAIYEASLEYWDRIYLTEVDLEVPDTDASGNKVQLVYFPEIKPKEWRLVSKKANPADEKNPYPYIFKILEKIG